MKTQKPQLSKGRPRFCPEERLLKRFYEPLVLLHILDRNGEQIRSHCPSIDKEESQLDLQELRRDFLNRLAYVCDHTPGGLSVTAIALEKQPSGVIFRVASNSPVSPSTFKFLQGILETLQGFALPQTGTTSSTIDDEIWKRSIDFNHKRIKTYRSFLQKPLQKCIEFLRRSSVTKDQTLANWLAKFQDSQEDPGSLCRFSYEQRASSYMKDLRRFIGDIPSALDDVESVRQNFLLTRHYIGRLSTHLKAAKILVAAAKRLPDLFENFTIEIQPPPKPALSNPPTDQMTTLEGILTRMLPAESEKLAEYRDALSLMDSLFHIHDRVIAEYESKEFKPRVHAELILLEFFHTRQISFVDDDKFIGCSKPACYCCYHYICLHPGGFVRPPTHGVRYIGWRPPDVIDEENQEAKTLQRDVMNELIKQVRRDTFRHIDQRKGPSQWHPDSTTGITDSQAIRGPEIEQLEKLLKSVSLEKKNIPAANVRHWEKKASGYLASQTSDVAFLDDSSGSDGGATI